MHDLFGALPTSPGNRFYAEPIVRGHIAGIATGVSARLSLQTGLPRDVLGDGDLGLVELLPRGAGGTDPMVSQVDLRLFARLGGFDLQLEVFDAFDRRTTTLTEEEYAGAQQALRPIDGGTYSDLVWLRTDGGAPVARNPQYDFPRSFQGPATFVLGVHRAF